MNDIKNKIDADFIAAYKNKETDKKNFLGLLKSEIQNDEGRGIIATDENVIKRLKGIEKGLVHVMNMTNSDTSDELDILRLYLPKMLDVDTMKSIVIKMNAEGSKMPDIMKYFKDAYPGQIDNKQLADIIKNVSK